MPLFPFLFQNDKPTNKKKLNSIEYTKHNFLTNCEKVFYQKLISIEEYGDYKVIPQVNLASLIQKKSNSRYNTELFRNIDFAIFNHNFDILLLIELNDVTHEEYRRKKRDQKVKDIFQKAHTPYSFSIPNIQMKNLI